MRKGGKEESRKGGTKQHGEEKSEMEMREQRADCAWQDDVESEQ